MTSIIFRLDTWKHNSHLLSDKVRYVPWANWKCSKAWQPLTSWGVKGQHCQYPWDTVWHSIHSLTKESRTTIISKLEVQRDVAATNNLRSQGQALSAGLKGNKAQHQHTFWRFMNRCQINKSQQILTPQQVKGRHCVQGLNTAWLDSHSPSKEWMLALSADLKCSKPQQQLTNWSVKYRHHQQVWNMVRYSSHSQTGEPEWLSMLKTF